MELKDVILSTLAEMEETNTQEPVKPQEIQEPKAKIKNTQSTILTPKINDTEDTSTDGELVFLTSMRERLLVLFEGFQAPNNTNIEAKIDMTLNFLEYMLANIDSRVEELEKSNKH